MDPVHCDLCRIYPDQIRCAYNPDHLLGAMTPVKYIDRGGREFIFCDIICQLNWGIEYYDIQLNELVIDTPQTEINSESIEQPPKCNKCNRLFTCENCNDD
jgi:hypothetical protein